MKIYEIHFRNDEDNDIYEFYPSKRIAQSRYAKLSEAEKNGDYEDDNNGVNLLYDISSFDVEINKNGILYMLNSQFGQR